MKQPSPSFPAQRGAALIIVLSIIVLLAALVTGFLVRAGMERSASASYDAAANTKVLSETAVNLVQAAINEATTANANSAWASQPGAIRVFNNTGSLEKIYRLYSSSELVTETSNGSVLQNDVPPANWSSEPAAWVDLNKPVTVSGLTDSNGTATADFLVFPILDPRNPTSPGSAQAPNILTGMEGFSITNAPGATAIQPAPMPVRWLYVLRNGKVVSPTGSGGTVTVDGATRENPIVGRVAFWADDETSKVNINTAAGSFGIRNGVTMPGAWDIPRFRIWDELRSFSQNQPTQGEYQRYPGHPASTDLYRILTALGVNITDYPYTLTNASSLVQPIATGTPSSLFKLLPRYNDDYGSQGGTANTTKAPPTPITVKNQRLFTSVGELLYDPKRTSNGLSRQQVETGKFFLTAQSRAPEVTLFGTPRISIWPIDSAFGQNPVPSNTTPLASLYDRLISFCSTTGPSDQRKPYYFQRHDSTSPTADWELIPRNQALYSYLQNLTSRAIPGFGGNFNEKYASGERDQILTEIVDYIRSTNVWDHSLASTSVPRFTPAYGNAGWGQVVPLRINNTQGLGRMYTISEAGLLIIATADGDSSRPYQAPETKGSQLISPVNGSAGDPAYVSNLAEPQYLRAEDGRPVGLVAFSGSTPGGSVIQSTGTAANVNDPAPGAPFPANPTLADTFGGTKTRLNPGQIRLQAMLLFELSSPMAGYDAMLPDLAIDVSGLQNLLIDGKSPFAQSNGLLTTPGPERLNYTQNYGGLNAFQYPISKRSWGGSSTRYNGWSQSFVTGGSPYFFVSKPFTVSTSGPLDIASSGVIVQLKVRPKGGGGQPTVVAQTFDLNFPPASTLPKPDLLHSGVTTVTSGTGTSSAAADFWGFDNRIRWVGSYPMVGGTNIAPNYGFGSVIRSDPTTPAASWSFDSTAAFAIPFYKNADGSLGPTPRSDVVRTLIPPGGDTRLVMAKSNVNANGVVDLVKHPGYDSGRKLVNSFQLATKSNAIPGSDLSGKLVPGADYFATVAPKVDSSLTPRWYWDWDSGLPSMADGPYANKPDEGNIYTNNASAPYPYFNAEQAGDTDKFPSYFTPNRIIPSPVMFGSLPTGVKGNIPWRTLRFRPTPPGTPLQYDPAGPKDHLLLDFFNMPVVEPYAISEPFSTAGKVNMNYQIVPFTYINRSTGVRAVLSSETMARVPLGAEKAVGGNNNSGSATASYYKATPGTTPSSLIPVGATASLARLPLNLDETSGTLKQFKDKFGNWEIFRSASEICDLYLVPQGYTADNIESQWYGNDFAMIGDNVRERPYANIYPRLTTKSNTFTVHYTVQTLKNPPTANPNEWTESRGAVTGELRGSTTLERFLDPADPKIPDYATNANAASLDTFYQWRVISSNSFAP